MKYLSKLMSMLLVGAMLFTVGCTDYDEDIKNLEQKVDDIVETLYNDEINPLKADLVDTKANLEQLKQDLEDALAALETKHDKDIADLKKNLEDQIAEANKKILALEGALADEVAAREAAITTLTNQLNEAKTELQGKIDAEATARANGDQALADNLAQEIKDRQNAISALETKLQGEIDTLESSMNGNIQDLREEMNEAIEDANEAIENAVATLKSELNTKIDGEISAREQAIAALKQQIADAQSDLQGKIDAEATARANGDKTLADNLAKEIQDRKDAISALETKLQGEIDALEKAYKAADAELQKKIDDTNLALAAEATKREDADKALQAAIDAEKEAREAGDAELTAKYEALVKALEEEIAAREAAIEALKGELAALKNINGAQHAEYEKQIAALQAGLERAEAQANAKFEALESSIAALKAELEAQIAANKAAIAGNTSAINNLNGQVANLNNVVKNLQDTASQTLSMLMNHMGEFYSFQASVNGQLAVLQAKDAQLEAAIEKINEQIDALSAQIDTNAALIEQNVLNIAANSALIAELKAAAAETYRILSEADQALWNAINTLSATTDAEFAAVRAEAIKAQAELRNEMTAGFAAIQNRIDGIEEAYMAKDVVLFEQITSVYNELTQRLANEAAAREAADKAMSEAFISFKASAEMRLAELEKATAELRNDLDALQQDFLKFKDEIQIIIAESITKAINIAVEKSNDYTDTKINELYAKITKETAAKIEALQKDLQGKIDALEAKHDKAVSDLTTKIETAVDNLQKQIDTILSRVQSIVFVPEYSDGKGTIDYAMAGDTLVETRSTMVYQVYPAECAALIANAPVENVTFNIEGLKTRGAEAQFNVVALKGETNGRLYVTFETRNLGADFYAGKMEYAASLVLTTELENLSTVYTNVVPTKTPEQISMAIMYGDKEISGRYNLTEDGAMYKFEYTDTETIEEVLPEHYVAFTVAGKTYKGIKELNAAGYALELNCANYIHREYNEEFGTLPFEVADANVDGILEVKVKEVNGALIYNILKVGYTYTAGTLKSTAYSDFVTVPVQADINFEAVSANWTYSKDANVDANNSGAYTRVLPLTVVNHNLPEDVKSVAEVIALAPNSVKVTLDGEETSVAAKLIAKGEELFLEIANFAWDKAYDIEAKYSVMKNGQPVVEATAKIAFNTTDRNREPITINFDPAVAKFERNLQLTNQFSDNLDVAYQLLVFGNDNYDIACDKYLAENFVVDYTYVDALMADGKKVDILEPNTMLAIDGVNNGKNIYTAFCYADFDFVPTQVEYTKTVTTWYGQEFIINKVLNFEFPVYDFKHNSKYVYGGGFDFYSQVHPEYTWNNDDETQGLLKFDVAAVDLRAAFSVVDAEGKSLSDDQLAALSLSYNFEIEDNNHDGIEINTNDELSYYGANPFVNVRGNLVITNDNGAKYVVPTSFDEGGKYASYNVVKFNPIGTAEVISNPTVMVNNSIAYTIHILDYVKLMDHRTGGRQNYDLITDGAWVLGNGLNGFAEGVDVRADYMYRITETWVDDYSDVDPEIRPYITMNNGTLTFDNSQQLELTAPFTIPVTLKFQNCWMETPQQVTVKVTFNPIK